MVSWRTVGEGVGAGEEKEVRDPVGSLRAGSRESDGVEREGAPERVAGRSTGRLEELTLSGGGGDWVGFGRTVEITVEVTVIVTTPSSATGGVEEEESTGGVEVGRMNGLTEDGLSDRVEGLTDGVEDGSMEDTVEDGLAGVPSL